MTRPVWHSGFRAFIPIVLSFIFVLFFFNIPVLKDFSYEFAVAYALALFFISSGYMLARRKLPNPGRVNIRVFIFQLFFIIGMPLVAGAISCYHAGFDCFLHGARFYFIFSLPALVTGAGLAAYSIALSRKYAPVLWFLFVLLLVFLSLLEVFLNPQVYSFNPIIGFYPGVIYDELLPLGLEHFAYRAFTSLYFLLPFVLFFPSCKSIRIARSIKLIIPLIGLFFYLLAPQLGFATSENTLKTALPETIETEHFSIHLPGGCFDKNEKQYIAKLHELCYAENAVFFNVHSLQKISSFIFRNDEQKYKLTGAGAADIAKPWLSQIFITGSDYEASIKHEIAHVFTADFGYSPLKIAHGFNFLLLEGAATAADGFVAGKEIDYLTTLALKQNKVPDMSALYSGFNFFSANTAMAYTVSGSFCSYMITKYGIENFKIWYQSGFDSTLFGQSLSACWKDFTNELAAKEYDFPATTSQLYFGSPPFIYKKFPRFVAAKKQTIDRLIEQHQYGAALSGVERLRYFSNDPGILFRQVFLLDTLGMNTKAIQLMKEFIDRNTDSPNYFSSLIRLGDLYIKTGASDSARITFSKLYYAAPNENFANAAEFRLLLLADGVYQQYLKADASEKFAITLAEFKKKPAASILLQIARLNGAGANDHFDQIRELTRLVNFPPALPQETGFALCELGLRHGDAVFAKHIFNRIRASENGESVKYQLFRDRLQAF